ncbi:hypothetical protein GJ744_003056 [Endocarpon pusillum]|uniref:GPI inositol-deacylase winged helix domain-containing protein n=1 Tax=Endocarpon pusillum TaxID=364733 RepID=A0A8H7DYD7_9EURO|nr:hypothetical protein GJ744_003056 [Endocarpon pusillum]
MRWIYGAQRPLKLSELAEALSLDDSFSSTGQVKVDALREIITNCEDLLEINVTDDTVSFVHESIPELLSQNEQWSLKYETPLSMFYIEHESVQSKIANTLMAYLYGGCLDDPAFHNPASDPDQSTGEVFRAFLDARMKAYPFLDYCITFMIDHLQTVISEDEVFTWYFFDPPSLSPQRDAWWAAYRSLQVSE